MHNLIKLIPTYLLKFFIILIIINIIFKIKAKFTYNLILNQRLKVNLKKKYIKFFNLMKRLEQTLI